MVLRYYNGMWWIRNIFGFIHEEDAFDYARNKWKAGGAVDIRVVKGKWYVWRSIR